jgi:hypothetical protein
MVGPISGCRRQSWLLPLIDGLTEALSQTGLLQHGVGSTAACQAGRSREGRRPQCCRCTWYDLSVVKSRPRRI